MREVERPCDCCGVVYVAKTARSRFCTPRCRLRFHKRGAEAAVVAPLAVPLEPPSTKVQGPLGAELQGLGVADTYEGAVALGLAAQLDGGAVTGTAYVSLSKELDRRVEDLRRRAVKADDQTVGARTALREKRLRLA